MDLQAKQEAAMTEWLQELCDWRGGVSRIDEAAGVIRGVKVLGTTSRNGRTYLPEALSAAAGLYEGAKVNVNHPKRAPHEPRDYQDRLGVLRHVAYQPRQGLFGDLYFNPRHALAEQLLWDAQHAPENVGLSHNVEARTSRQGEQTVVEAILRVQSVDLVADPATTRGLFEAAGAESAAPAADNAEPDAAEDRETTEPVDGSDLAAADSETTRLRERVAELEAGEIERRHYVAIAQLLEASGLEAFEREWPAARREGPRFGELLAEVHDLATVKALIEERTAWLAAIGRGAGRVRRPTSRDQRWAELPAARATSTAEWARAIDSGRR
ncbi:MAG: hypothetical protein K1X74_00590 [Pirellulales bacterium]|nr:hypothetical protein [Pirellulales bacterium]